MMYVTWAMVSFGMLPKFQALMRQKVEGLKNRPRLKGAWYVFFVALLCAEVGVLAHVGMTVSDLLDRLLVDQNKSPAPTTAGRFVLQLVLCLVFGVMGLLLMVVTDRLVSSLRDWRNKRAERAQQQDPV